PNVSIRPVTGAAPARVAGSSQPASSLAAPSAPAPVVDLAAADPFWSVRVRLADDASGDAARFSRLALRYQDREIAAAEVAGDGIATPLMLRFDRDDLKALFAGLAGGRQPVTATVIGERLDGPVQSAPLALEVVGAPEPLRPVLTPNPMRASGSS